MAELENLEFDIRPISHPIVPYLIVMAEESAKGSRFLYTSVISVVVIFY